MSSIQSLKVSYPKLSDEDLGNLVLELEELIVWLKDHQIGDQDFIRQALIDGLENFYFRITRLRWLGWGYALDSLREVIAAYMFLERGNIEVDSNPIAAAAVKKVGAVIKTVYKSVSSAKDVSETSGWLLKAYGLGSMLHQSGITGLAGLDVLP